MRVLYLALIILWGMLVLTAAASAEDCALKQYASLDLLDLPEAAVIEVSIAGKPYHFVVDTGGVYTMLDRDVADALGLQGRAIDRRVEIYDAAGNMAKTYVDVPDVAIGPMKLGEIKMVVRDRPKGQDRVDGILAPDFLAQFEMDFDFGARKLNLFSSDHCEGKVVYWAKSYVDADFKPDGAHIEIPMNLDGHDVLAYVDTGSTRTLLRENLSRDFFGLDVTSPQTERIPGTKDGDVVQYSYRFKSLSLNGLAVSNPLVAILPDHMQQSFRNKHEDKLDLDPIYGVRLQTPQMILGMNVLTKLHLFVSYKEHKLYLTAADAH